MIYLPPGYDPHQRYTALYCIYDVLFNWRFGEWLDERITAGMPPLIADAVPSPDLEDIEPDHRFIETER